MSDALRGLHLHVDGASGAAGDMMLGALLDLGVPREVIEDAFDRVGLGRERLEVERVLALPILRGRRLPGIPADADGFVQTDEHCRVRGVDAVWAVGDCTALAVKSGGLAAEQADVAAADIAALAGADVEAAPFEPDAGDGVSGLPVGRHLTSWLVGEDEGLTTQLPPSGVPVLTSLQRDLAAGWRGYG